MWIHTRDPETGFDHLVHLETAARITYNQAEIYWWTPDGNTKHLIADLESVKDIRKLFTDILVRLKNKQELIKADTHDARIGDYV